MALQELILMGSTPSQQNKELRVKIFQSLHKTDIFQHQENPELRMKKTMDIIDFIFFSLKIYFEQKMEQQYIQFQKKSRISKFMSVQQFMDIYSSNMKEILNKLKANRYKNGQQLAVDRKQLEKSKVKITSKISIGKNDKNSSAVPNKQGSSQAHHHQKSMKEERSNSQLSHLTSKSGNSSVFNLSEVSSNSYNYPKQTEELIMQERKLLEYIQMNSIHKQERTQASIEKINQLEQKISQLQEQKTIDQNIIQYISSEKEQLLKKNLSLQKIIASQKQLISSLQKDIDSLNACLKERDQKCQELKQKKDSLEIQIMTLKLRNG